MNKQVILEKASEHIDVEPFQQIVSEYEDQINSLISRRYVQIAPEKHIDLLVEVYHLLDEQAGLRFTLNDLMTCELIYLFALTSLKHKSRGPSYGAHMASGAQDFIYIAMSSGLDMSEVMFLFSTATSAEEDGQAHTDIRELINFVSTFHNVPNSQQVISVDSSGAISVNGDIGLDHKKPENTLDVEGSVDEDDEEVESLTLTEDDDDPLDEIGENATERPRKKIHSGEESKEEEDPDFDSWYESDEEEEDDVEEEPSDEDRTEASRDFEEMFGGWDE